MRIRLTIDLDFLIHDCEAVTEASPYSGCGDIALKLKVREGLPPMSVSYAGPPRALARGEDNSELATALGVTGSPRGVAPLSPSTRWACYDFDAFREGMRNAPAEVEIAVSVSDQELRLVADIRSDLPLPATVALNGIVEDADGVNRFWALAFRPGAPEFHAGECRALELTA